jgi:steroid delta-isomerase-like uncharacterized protein
MNIRRRVLAGAVTAAVVGLAAAGTTAASAQGAVAQPAAQSESAHVQANEKVVEEFIADVLNGHNADHAARYLAQDVVWHGGTVGTVSGETNVAGLMNEVVTSIPDLHYTQYDIVAQGDDVVVRGVVTGTQKGALLNIPASGHALSWDATDWYHLEDGKIVNDWAAEDFTAFLYDTGAYKAPWIQ